MSTELALRNADPIALGEVMFASKMFPDAKSAVQATIKILAGQEYGLGAVAAMSGIHVIDNKPVPGAHVLAGLVKRSARYDYHVREHTNTKCALEFFDRQLKGEDGGWLSLGVSEFTFEDAKRAGLSGRQNWQRYPRNMLFARALANGVRWYCPDVTQTGQVLVAEEAADMAGVDYAPPGAVAEPVQVENLAARWQASEADITVLRDLYERSGWMELPPDPEPDGFDAHAVLRMRLVAVGARNDGALRGLLEALTREQYDALHAQLAEAAVQATFDATEEGEAKT